MRVVLAMMLSWGCADASPQRQELAVFAAASLREAFLAIGAGFEAANPAIRVTFNFAGSQALRAQVEHGANADVVAAADDIHMDPLRAAGLVATPLIFARNEPVLVVASGHDLQSFAQLDAVQRIVIGAADVPIGRYAQEILDRAEAQLGTEFRARVERHIVSRELSTRQVLAKVIMGEADAGIVYRTDAQAAQPKVQVLPIPSTLNVVANYPIAVGTHTKLTDVAQAWVRYVLSPEGQETLSQHGFVVL